MSILNILRFPNPKLRNQAKPVLTIDDNKKQLILDMFETMYAEKGVGLAATQVGISLRIVVVDCADKEQEPNPIEFINPEIIKKSEQIVISEEGCLSVPEVNADIERAEFVTIRAMDKDGKEFELNCSGLLAICLQHEIDHLNGKLFIDYLSVAKRNLIRIKMKKLERKILRESKKSND